MKKAIEKEKKSNKVRHPRQGSQQQQAGSSKPPPQLSQSLESLQQSSTNSSFSGYPFDSQSSVGSFDSESSVSSFDSKRDNKPLTESQCLRVQEHREAQNADRLRLLNSGRLESPKSVSAELLEQTLRSLSIEQQIANHEQQKPKPKQLQRQQQINAGFPPKPKWSESISEKADCSITKQEKTTSSKKKKKKKNTWSGSISENDPHITISELTDADLQEKKNIKNLLPAAVKTIRNENVKRNTAEKVENGNPNIAFAKYKIDGKDGKIHSLSGKANMKGFAKYPPNSRRKFKTVDVGGFNREADTEVKILEQIYAMTTKHSTGTIRLFTLLPVCKSCGGVIEQFTKERPEIKIKVVEERS